jgi:hypothetical protein
MPPAAGRLLTLSRVGGTTSSRRARSGSGCWFESSSGHGIHFALTALLALCTINEKQKLVKQAWKMIRKAVVRMCKVWNTTTLWMTVLTGGFLAWTGRDAVVQ